MRVGDGVGVGVGVGVVPSWTTVFTHTLFWHVPAISAPQEDCPALAVEHVDTVHELPSGPEQ